MSKKLFIVRTEIETVVLAEDEDDACEVAAEWKNDITDEANLYSSYAWDATPCRVLPPNWDMKSLPWGSDDDDKDVGYYLRLAKDETDKEASELAEDIADIMEIDD